MFQPLVNLILRGALSLYKLLVSPLLGNRCRFYPYCSDYAVEAIEHHGFIRGTFLSIRRLLRCNPWCKGGHDPVPK